MNISFKRISKGIIQIIILILFGGAGFIYVQTNGIRLIDKYVLPFKNKLFLNNRLILIDKERVYKMVYKDRDDNEINLEYEFNYKEDENNEIKEANLNNTNNFFDYFQPLSLEEKDMMLYNIEVLKKSSGKGDITDEFNYKLDKNGYVGYYENDVNNLYIFAHNGSYINSGRLFYDFEKGDEIKFINSLIDDNQTLTLDEKKVVSKQNYIKDFDNKTGIFKNKNSIFFITCYPNYNSTQRLIFRVDGLKK